MTKWRTRSVLAAAGGFVRAPHTLLTGARIEALPLAALRRRRGQRLGLVHDINTKHFQCLVAMTFGVMRCAGRDHAGISGLQALIGLPSTPSPSSRYPISTP